MGLLDMAVRPQRLKPPLLFRCCFVIASLALRRAFVGTVVGLEGRAEAHSSRSQEGFPAGYLKRGQGVLDAWCPI